VKKDTARSAGLNLSGMHLAAPEMPGSGLGQRTPRVAGIDAEHIAPQAIRLY